MDAICDGRHRNLVFPQVRPYDLPHAACDAAMQVTDTIAPFAHPQRENGHVERISELYEIHEFLASQLQLFPVAVEMLFHHVEGKCVVTGRNRSVRREYRR